jgi:riboflavin kinase/FMN adenylyltransferase
VANIGFRPTVEGGRKVPILEVHLLDFEGEVYGRHVRVDFLERIRDEVQFGSLDELRAQIARDVARARAWHETHPAQ